MVESDVEVLNVRRCQNPVDGLQNGNRELNEIVPFHT